MNQIKLMCEVVKAMRKKRSFNGTLQVEARQDRAEVFHLNNEFAKDTENGQFRSKIETEFDYEGQTMKHESNTELRMPGCQGIHNRVHRNLEKLIHCRLGMIHDREYSGECCTRVKAGLNHIFFLLHFLNHLKLEDMGDRGFVLSISSEDFPDDFKRDMCEIMKRHREAIDQYCKSAPEQECKIFQALHGLEKHEVELSVIVNRNYEIEKAIVVLRGAGKNENGVEQLWDAKAELDLIW